MEILNKMYHCHLKVLNISLSQLCFLKTENLFNSTHACVGLKNLMKCC